MAYEGPTGPMKSDERVLVPAMPLIAGEENATEELMKQLPDMVAYGMLLLDDPKHPMAELVRERWSEIHNLTGDTFLLFTFERPAEWAANYLQYWRNKRGDEFDAIWKKWQGQVDPGSAYTYLNFFKPPLKATQLPCLVLFTDIEEHKAVVRPIPDWDKDSLFALLKSIVDVIRESAHQPAEKRLGWLEHQLTTPRAQFLAQVKHIGSLAQDYFEKHPAFVVTTAISVVLGLSGAGLFTLPVAATAVLSVIKDTLTGTKPATA